MDAVSYPPTSVEKLLSALFLSGSAPPEAFHDALALLAYYLLDAGFMSTLDPLRCEQSLALKMIVVKSSSCGLHQVICFMRSMPISSACY